MVDIYSISFKNFKVLSVEGYPHGRNDIFYCRILRDSRIEYAFIKVARDDFSDLDREIAVLNKMDFNFTPEVIESNTREIKYIVTKAIRGKRLSQKVMNDNNRYMRNYIKNYVEALVLHHRLTIDFEDVEDRPFFHLPSQEYFTKYNLESYREYLLENKPEKRDKVFVHGDMHYANILFDGKEVVAVLDYELAGKGVREFDMAWSIFLRPGQKFFKSKWIVEYFLEEYGKYESFNRVAFYYYFTLIASRFISFGEEDYIKSVHNLMPFKVR